MCQADQKQAEEIKVLKSKLSVFTDNEIQIKSQLDDFKMKLVVCQEEKAELERKLDFQETLTECAYEKKMVVDKKAEVLEIENKRSKNELKRFSSDKDLLLCHVEGLQNGICGMRAEIESKENENNRLVNEISRLKCNVNDLKVKSNEQNEENSSLYELVRNYKISNNERNEIHREVLKKLNVLDARYQTPNCFIRCIKKSRKKQIINELQEIVSDSLSELVTC